MTVYNKDGPEMEEANIDDVSDLLDAAFKRWQKKNAFDPVEFYIAALAWAAKGISEVASQPMLPFDVMSQTNKAMMHALLRSIKREATEIFAEHDIVPDGEGGWRRREETTDEIEA